MSPEGAPPPARPDLLAGRPTSRIAHPRPARRTGQEAGRQVVTLTVFRFDAWSGRARQFASMAWRRWALRGVPSIGFARMMGTGTGWGFDPAPDTAVWTVLATWDDLAAARQAVAARPLWADRRRRADETATLFLAPLSSSGRWSGVAPFEPCSAAAHGGEPLAVLTRGTIRTRHAVRFWRKVPAINRQIAEAARPGGPMRFMLGMGEIPLLHQVTFSVWSDAAAMRAFAYRGAGHASAIAGVRAGGWFAEELYARFAVIHAEGDWRGRPILA